MILVMILPNIENEAKVNESFKLVLFCLKYEINPVNDENNITNVEVSTAISIGINRNNVIIETKKTPPPIPAIVEIIPDKRPNIINIVIKIDVSMLN